MTEPAFDKEKGHRFFAVELNNLAWGLVEARHELSSVEAERMLHAAHASCFHWLEVGSPLNHQRAQCLVACVHIKLG